MSIANQGTLWAPVRNTFLDALGGPIRTFIERKYESGSYISLFLKA